MKIDLTQLIDGEQITLHESQAPEAIDLEVEGIKIISPIEIEAEVVKIQDTLDVKAALKSKALMQCSRCLTETEVLIRKELRLDYSISKQDTIIDITDDIRQEIILEYPLKPLCAPLCKGLCLSCGKNLNEGPCNCKKLQSCAGQRLMR